jgi:hypothetical protein
MANENSPEVKVLVVEQSSEPLSDQENQGKFPTLTEADWEMILKGFSEFGMKEYKINFLEITDQELIEKLKTYYSETREFPETKVPNHKTKVLVIGSGHLQNELRGRLASACAIDSEGFNRSEEVETEAHSALSIQEIGMLKQAFDNIFGISRRRSLIDMDIMCHPVIVDNTIYPKKSPNSYSEVQKQQAFFNKKRHK